MTVNVLFFAHQRDIFGKPEVSIDMPAPATVADLAQKLEEIDGRFGGLLGYTRVAVNEDWASAEAPISEGDTIAFIPPMSGG